MLRWRHFLAWISILLTHLSHAEEKKPPRSLTKDVLAIRFHGPRGDDDVSFALWKDGYCVFRASERDDKGLRTLRSGQLSPKLFSETVTEVEHAGFFDDKRLQQESVGPDGAYYTLTVVSEKKKLVMLSWHEPYEANGKLFAGKGGLMPLDGKTRLEALKQQPADYLYYRFAWNELKSTLLDLRPSQSEACTGKIGISDDGPVWEE